ncbi:GNAT family N-acetyltransferase [bacterium]|nr:GNAT family N-acetyltransferase [bacterium]
MDIQKIYGNWEGMKTSRLAFRKLSLDDKEAIFHYSSDPEVTKYVLYPTHQSFDDTLSFINQTITKYEKQEVSCWGVTLQSTHQLIGTADFVWWSTDHRKAEAAYCFSKEYWNQGYATEALMGLITFGFTYMDLNRVETRCFEENKASARVMQKAGMTHEGLLREVLYAKNQFRNTHYYSILKTDYLQNPLYKDFPLEVTWGNPL